MKEPTLILMPPMRMHTHTHTRKEITAACENYDVEAFTNAVVEFDSLTKLDKWKTNILLKIKNTIKEEGEEGEDNLQ